MARNNAEQRLLSKIKRLPPEKAAEVEDFIDFLSQESEVARAATRLSEDGFQKIWENPDDADYDEL